MTELLLIVGAVTTGVFLVVLFVEGAVRVGYRPTYHPGSDLSLGDRGWVQRTNFVQMGLGMLVFAMGVARALDTVAAPVCLAVFGVLLFVSGVFPPDALRRYPPGAEGTVTRSGTIHNIAGPLAFVAILAAALFLVGLLDGGWESYTLATAVVGFGFTVWDRILVPEGLGVPRSRPEGPHTCLLRLDNSPRLTPGRGALASTTPATHSSG